MIYVSIDMLAYMFNVGIGDLCQHRFSITSYMFNDGIGDLCQHRLSMLVFMFNVDRFNGDLCQHRFLYVGIHVQ